MGPEPQAPASALKDQRQLQGTGQMKWKPNEVVLKIVDRADGQRRRAIFTRKMKVKDQDVSVKELFGELETAGVLKFANLTFDGVQVPYLYQVLDQVAGYSDNGQDNNIHYTFPPWLKELLAASPNKAGGFELGVEDENGNVRMLNRGDFQQLHGLGGRTLVLFYSEAHQYDGTRDEARRQVHEGPVRLEDAISNLVLFALAPDPLIRAPSHQTLRAGLGRFVFMGNETPKWHEIVFMDGLSPDLMRLAHELGRKQDSVKEQAPKIHYPSFEQPKAPSPTRDAGQPFQPPEFRPSVWGEGGQRPGEPDSAPREPGWSGPGVLGGRTSGQPFPGPQPDGSAAGMAYSRAETQGEQRTQRQADSQAWSGWDALPEQTHGQAWGSEMAQGLANVLGKLGERTAQTLEGRAHKRQETNLNRQAHETRQANENGPAKMAAGQEETVRGALPANMFKLMEEGLQSETHAKRGEQARKERMQNNAYGSMTESRMPSQVEQGAQVQVQVAAIQMAGQGQLGQMENEITGPAQMPEAQAPAEMVLATSRPVLKLVVKKTRQAQVVRAKAIMLEVKKRKIHQTRKAKKRLQERAALVRSIEPVKKRGAVLKKTNAPPTQAILFDLDGVLSDSEELHRQTFNETFAPFGVRVGKAYWYAHYIGTGSRHIVQDLIRRFKLEGADEDALVNERKARFQEAVLRGRLKAVPGALELVKWARKKGLKIAVASGGHRDNIAAQLEALGLDGLLFFGLEDVKHRKPDPEVFIKAAHAIGVEPAQCLVIEDSAAGLKAARTAGMQSVLIGKQHPKAFQKQAGLYLKKLQKEKIAGYIGGNGITGRKKRTGRSAHPHSKAA